MRLDESNDLNLVQFQANGGDAVLIRLHGQHLNLLIHNVKKWFELTDFQEVC